MKSLFTRLFSNLLISSFVVLVTMIFIAFVAIKYSVHIWNTSKKTDLENLTTSIITEIYESEGILDGEILHQALKPYLLNSHYLFIFDNGDKVVVDAVNLISSSAPRFVWTND